MTVLWVLVGAAVVVVIASQRLIAGREGRRAVRAHHRRLDTLDHITTHTREQPAPDPRRVHAHVRLVREGLTAGGDEPTPAWPPPAASPPLPSIRPSRCRPLVRRFAWAVAIAAVVVVAIVAVAMARHHGHAHAAAATVPPAALWPAAP